MSENIQTAYDIAIAGPLDDVVATMNIVHDNVIRATGSRRTSGVWWEIYGSDMAGLLARRRAAVAVEAKDVNGTWEEGLERAEFLFDETGRDNKPELLAGLIAFGVDYPHPTLIIGFCHAKAPRTEKYKGGLGRLGNGSHGPAG